MGLSTRQTVLVTGGAGYIGSHTVLELIKAGHRPVVLDNLSNSSAEALRRVARRAQHVDHGTSAREAVGGDENPGVGIGQTQRNCLGPVTRKHWHEQRAELGNTENCRDCLGNHRTEDPDSVARTHAQVREMRGRRVGLLAQMGKRPLDDLTTLALPDDGGGSGRLGRPAIATPRGRVEPPTTKPSGPRDPGGVVEHSFVGRVEPQAELIDHRVPKPLRLGDRPCSQLGQRREPVSVGKCRHPRLAQESFRGNPRRIVGNVIELH
jgi:hypothetical protein